MLMLGRRAASFNLSSSLILRKGDSQPGIEEVPAALMIIRL